MPFGLEVTDTSRARVSIHRYCGTPIHAYAGAEHRNIIQKYKTYTTGYIFSNYEFKNLNHLKRSYGSKDMARRRLTICCSLLKKNRTGCFLFGPDWSRIPAKYAFSSGKRKPEKKNDYAFGWPVPIDRLESPSSRSRGEPGEGPADGRVADRREGHWPAAGMS